MTAEQAKQIALQFNKELGFVNLAALRVSATNGELEVIPDIGFASYHHRRDRQTTIYDLAVTRLKQRQGWGRLLFYRILCSSIEKGCDRLVAKCPEDLESNSFYLHLGFKLLRVESGRKRKLNVWQYDIKLPLLFYCGDGGGSKYDKIAIECGWKTGIRSDRTTHQIHCEMVDNHWKKYIHSRHLEIVRHHKPLIATARDIECLDRLPEILAEASELAQYCGRVLLIPKCKFPLPTFNHWLGYSVPSGYGGTSVECAWFGDRPVHLLGGSPDAQATYGKELNTISLDANYAMSLARYGKSCWQGFSSGVKVVQGNYPAFQKSLLKQQQYWHKSWDWSQEPLGNIG